MSKTNTIYFSFSLLLLIMLVTPACEWFKKKEAATQETLREVVEPKFHLLDVNSKELYADVHIPGAVNASLENVEEITKGWNKKTPVVVYCSSYECGASHTVAKKLKELGFEDIGVYSGGIQEWHALSKEKEGAAYPIEGEAKNALFASKVVKVEPKQEEGVRNVSASDLAKLIEESKAEPAKAA